LNDVELHVIALFQSFVSIQLNCGVVNEYVWPVFTPDESVALGVVKPLDLSFVLSHRLPPSLHLKLRGERGLKPGGSFASISYDEESYGKVDYDFHTFFHKMGLF
jgi:hypothetical protein